MVCAGCVTALTLATLTYFADGAPFVRGAIFFPSDYSRTMAVVIWARRQLQALSEYFLGFLKLLL